MVQEDRYVKGIWCVPKYSNPTGITYSDEVVRRMAALNPAQMNFGSSGIMPIASMILMRMGDQLASIMAYARSFGHEDMVYQFASTSKVTFPGAGIAAFAGSKNNVEHMLRLLGGPDDWLR